MSFNGSGVFNRLYSWANDAAANIKIRADRMDNEMNGMATGLSTCITKDGQTTVTANLPMATYRHTGVGDGAARTDYTSVGQTQDGKIHWVAAGGTADAITATYSIPVTALVDGQICYVRAGAANATTTPTFSPNSLTARTIVKNGGQALVAGDIYGAGHELVLRYNLANTRWELMNPAVVASAAVTDATISTSDITTNNASTAKHGWMPKAANSATTYYDSLGTQTNPALNAVLTGYTSGAGTVSATDTILQAIQKLNGNDAPGNNSTYRTILTVEGSESGASGSTRVFSADGASPIVPSSGSTTGMQFIYIDPADYPTVGSLTTKLRIRGQILVNNTAPTRTFTLGLYPVTSPAGGAGAFTFTLGTVVTGSDGATVASPAANSITNMVGSDFAIPSAGLYAIGIVYSGALAANCVIMINAQLQMRNT